MKTFFWFVFHFSLLVITKQDKKQLNCDGFPIKQKNFTVPWCLLRIYFQNFFLKKSGMGRRKDMGSRCFHMKLELKIFLYLQKFLKCKEKTAIILPESPCKHRYSSVPSKRQQKNISKKNTEIYDCMFSCHVLLSEWIHTLYMAECQGISCSKQSKLLWVGVPLQSFKLQISRLFQARISLTFRQL